MEKKLRIITPFIALFFMIFLSGPANADSPEGFASVNALGLNGTTGGAGGNIVTVTNTTDFLINALSTDTVIIQVAALDNTSNIPAIVQNGAGRLGYVTVIAHTEINAVKSYELLQNYPNPFNPMTNLEFRISNFSFVLSKIYDITGREMATIVSKKLPAGSYQYQWDAHGFASGIYFYQLEAE